MGYSGTVLFPSLQDPSIRTPPKQSLGGGRLSAQAVCAGSADSKSGALLPPLLASPN